MVDKGNSGERSRYAGVPGSITALRVDYGRMTSAFEPLESDRPSAQRREELKQWKAGDWGGKPSWNPTVECPSSKFPDRAKMRLLSTHQSIKIEPNFRAQQVPTCYKDTVFLPKQSKFEVDATVFLSSGEKDKLVGRNVGGALSRSEYQDRETHVGEKAWNTSVMLEHERASLHKRQEPYDYRLTNKMRVSKRNYVSPEKTVARLNQAQRQSKLADNQTAVAQKEELNRAPLTMKNKDMWMHLDPVKVALGEQRTGAGVAA